MSTAIEDFEECYEVKLPKHKIVCPRCRGNGTHVNPAVDGNGISPEQFHEDPDFAESYFSGVYDVVCEECGGKNVIDEVDESAMPEELLAEWHDWLKSEAETNAIYAMERMMGA